MAQASPTDCAPAERAPIDVVRAQYTTFVGTHCRALFDTLPTIILALNQFRQVVFANHAAVEFLGQPSVDQVLGARPGEVLGCVNVPDGGGGCGTSRQCRHCGMLRAILTAIDGVSSEDVCKLLRREDSVIEGMDMHVDASPLTFGGDEYIIFAITDISHETRRRSMEHIFFHDVLNLASGISGLIEVLHSGHVEGHDEELEVLHSASQTLVDEIIAQRELLAAENNELRTEFAPVSAREILQQIKGLYESSPVCLDQRIVIDKDCPSTPVLTDGRLAQRVLGNMLKNALEAGGPGDIVELACREETDMVRFAVHNPACMPPEVRDNVFHRRFSTKGETRGLGTYSMLLLTERYLHGNVSFVSTPAGGTTFFLRLPNHPKMR